MGGRGAANLESTFEFGQRISIASIGDSVPPPPGLQSADFKASRAKFLASDVPGFDPVPWLPVLEGATYLEPRLLEVTETCSDLPMSRFSAPRSEAVEFAELIDTAGRLHLARPEEAPVGDRMNVLAVYKSETVDRTVWDRRRRNCREAHLKGAASDLPGGYELCELEVPVGEKAFVFADDIADMYPTFIAPPERAVTNAMAVELAASECEHMKAFKRFAKVGGKADLSRQAMRKLLGLHDSGADSSPTSKPRTLVPCAASLVMGDLNAVDYATGAHESVLLHGGALPASSRLKHGQPVPRDHVMHALVIDDHIGLASGKSSSGPRVRRMASEFDAGTRACTVAGLPQHPTKRVRAETDAIVLGAEVVDGSAIGSERVRRMFLALVSLTMVRHRRVNGALMRRLLASWTYCVCFVQTSFHVSVGRLF